MESGVPAFKDDILKFAKKEYKTIPEYLWAKFPEFAVLRHSENRKWYGILMNIQKSKLGIDRDGMVEVLNIKCDPVMVGSLILNEGVLPAYHMSKGSWVTILLDGTNTCDFIFPLIKMSYELTLPKRKIKSKKDIQN